MKTTTEIERESLAASQALTEAISYAIKHGELPGKHVTSYIWQACSIADRMGLDATAVVGGDGKAVMGAIIDTLQAERDAAAVPDDPVWFRVGRIAVAATVAAYTPTGNPGLYPPYYPHRRR